MGAYPTSLIFKTFFLEQGSMPAVNTKGMAGEGTQGGDEEKAHKLKNPESKQKLMF